MTIQSINDNMIGFGNEKHTRFVNNRVNKNANNPEQYSNNYRSKQNINANLTSTYFSTSKMTLNYSNKDGDTISLQVEHVEYQKSMLSLGLTSDSEKWYEIVEKIKDEFRQLHRNHNKELIEGFNEKSPDTQESSASKGIGGLPEYWNAENTSQRIVDFATSFYGIAESSGKEYYDLVRSAIEEGFNQAREILGEIPNEVSELTNRTYDLVMEKLDDWAAQQGIETETSESIFS